MLGRSIILRRSRQGRNDSWTRIVLEAFQGACRGHPAGTFVAHLDVDQTPRRARDRLRVNFPFRRASIFGRGVHGRQSHPLSFRAIGKHDRFRGGSFSFSFPFPFPSPSSGGGWGGVARSWDCKAMRNKCSRSRGAIFVRTQAMSKPLPKTPSAPTFVGSTRRWCRRIHHDRARARTNERRKKQNAERGRVVTAAPAGCSAFLPDPPPLAGERNVRGQFPPSGVHLRPRQGDTAGPQGSASGHASQGGPERLVLSAAAPTGGRRPCALPTRKLPAPENQTSRPRSSEHLTCRHCAGRLMPDAARVQRGTNPQPASTTNSAPPAGVRPSSLRRKRDALF